jgi:hypothetical protein
MMFYKFSLKHLMIDGLVLGLGAFSLYNARTVAKASLDGSTIGLPEAYWITLACGVFLVRWAYLAWSYFYGESASNNPSLLFKIHKVWVTFGAVVSFIAYFAFIIFFL